MTYENHFEKGSDMKKTTTYSFSKDELVSILTLALAGGHSELIPEGKATIKLHATEEKLVLSIEHGESLLEKDEHNDQSTNWNDG